MESAQISYLLFTSLSSADAAYAALWLDARQRGLLWNTALLGTGTALLATAIGAPLGLALARIALPRKALLRLALAAPVLLPPYIVALAWTYLGSSRGIVAALAGRDLLSEWTYSVPAAIIVLSVVLYALAMLATEVALRRVDGRLEEAALVVAPPGRVLWRITLPLVARSVFAAALVIFVLAVSEFGVPGLLRVRVYTTEVFTAFAALYDFSRAGGPTSARPASSAEPLKLDCEKAARKARESVRTQRKSPAAIGRLLRSTPFGSQPC